MNDQLPGESDEIRRIAEAVRRVVFERPDAKQQPRRDVHRKHHGCVQASLNVLKNLPEELRQGVFAAPPGEGYKAWVRFSSSSKRAQSDAVPDGRGIAIKLLEVSGERAVPALNQKTTQDFVLLNAPAFFAPNATRMVAAAELEANDQFPSSFFLGKGGSAGFAALVRMTDAQADSPLDITYFSQTPYQLGADLVVKYRLRPLRQAPASHERARKDPHYLYEALKRDLDPNLASVEGPAVKFELAIQLQQDPTAFPTDDATVVWDETLSPFVPVAELVIPRQVFDTNQRMILAETISFNPWNALLAHKPLGSINQARLHAYHASHDARKTLDTANTEPEYTPEEWLEAQRATAEISTWTPDAVETPGTFRTVISGFAMLLPEAATWPEKILTSKFGYFVPVLLLFGLLGLGLFLPSWFCAPLMLGFKLPSEAAIPPAVYVPHLRGSEFEYNEVTRKNDPVWNFRYSAVGAEGDGGVPYWIFRALPSMFPEYFKQRGDWSEYGLGLKDDETYYTSYHNLPRGVVLTPPVANLGGNQIGLGLQLVTFNCATCHRGEYTNERGEPTFIDGMPNHGLDAAGYKMAVFRAFRSEKFNTETVVAAVDKLLAEEHAKRPVFPDGSPTPTALNLLERGLYSAIVAQARARAWAKPISWIEERPLNGPGRLDAFGALRFEFLGFARDQGTKHIATVDLPSIWHQQAEWRPAHHWDGNTGDTRARNFGAIVGIGGLPETLRKAELADVGTWIDQKKVPYLTPPQYPFDVMDVGERDDLTRDQLLNEGKVEYTNTCARCHGDYDARGKLLKLTGCMQSNREQGTDEFRLNAVDEEFVRRLNAFGASVSLWDPGAFGAQTGYLCPPLDGIWARAPYLHNGSVPTLWHLLGESSKRPVRPHLGNPVYDTKHAGFSWEEPPKNRADFILDTEQDGNSNKGHEYLLEPRKRRAVIAYLLTL